MPSITQPPTQGETPTFTFTEVHPGTATGSYNSTTGAVTLSDVLALSFHIDPLGDTCVSTPIDVALSGTYDSATQDLTLATTSSFTIPQFPTSATCIAPVAAGVNASPGGIAGNVGNSMSLALSGQFAPGLPTTTTLAASPDSPELAGTDVTLTATVTDPSAAGTPDGNVNFLNNGAVIGTEALSPGGTTGTATATYETSSLPGGTNQLSAVYVGSPSYATSASDSQSYAIQPAPSFTANLPTQITAGSDPVPFTLTISNPASGQSYPGVYAVFAFLGGSDQQISGYNPTLAYQDSAGSWCPLAYRGSAVYFPGPGSAPCGTPASMALDAGTTIAIPMEMSYAADTPGGISTPSVGLYTGSCTSQTTCTAVAPFTRPNWNRGTGPGFVTPITVLPAIGPGTIQATMTDGGPTRPATTPVQQGYDVALVAGVTSPANVLAFPTGTVQLFVDGQSVGTDALVSFVCHKQGHGECESDAPNRGQPLYYSTDDLAPGTHTVVMNYSGDSLFAANSFAETFTVLPGPPTGTSFTCTLPSLTTGPTETYQAYVSAVATVPATALADTTVDASDISVTLALDGAAYIQGTTQFNVGQGPTTFDFSPGGTATAGPITFSGVSPTSTEIVGTWSGMSLSVPVTGAPGSTVPIGVTSFNVTFPHSEGWSFSCADNDAAAPVGSVVVTGNTLTASPEGSAIGGAPVTLTDTVYPTPSGSLYNGGQVDFYDGTTDLATVPVDTSGGTANGTATFTTATLSVGDHQLAAIWTGNGTVGPNTSNTVDYTVGTDTTTSLASSANPANAANPVTFTATVSPPDSSDAAPTGDVSFTSDGNPITSCQDVALSMDSPPVATCTTSFGAGESHAIVATYGGDDTYLGSASDSLTQTTLPGTNTTILSTKDPSPPGKVTFWAGVSPATGTGDTPTGTVAFSIDGSTYKACNAQPLGPGGGASCTVSFKAGTTHKMFASYAGSAAYSGSKSATITQTVTGSKSLTNPKTTGGSATLASGKVLTSGQSMTAGAYKLVMQGDGNLVEYQGSKALWASGTAGHPGAGVTMQKDGNLVIYARGKAVWASKTAGHAGAHLTLQGSDGNVVIYGPGGNALWNAGT